METIEEKKAKIKIQQYYILNIFCFAILFYFVSGILSIILGNFTEAFVNIGFFTFAVVIYFFGVYLLKN